MQGSRTRPLGRNPGFRATTSPRPRAQTANPKESQAPPEFCLATSCRPQRPAGLSLVKTLFMQLS